MKRESTYAVTSSHGKEIKGISGERVVEEKFNCLDEETSSALISVPTSLIVKIQIWKAKTGKY
jgi:RNase P/RNase MRP subunit p29